MQKLYQNKYRISSARLQTWNYANPGMYFITICTLNRKSYFGEIIDQQMHLSELGRIAETEWIKSIELRPDMNLELGDFVVMPNHFHGIIIIGENQYNLNHGRDAMHRVSTTVPPTTNQFAPQSKNLASIIRGFKSAVTAYARKNQIDFQWQPRFHDRVIRSTDEYIRVSKYIEDNPMNWKDDRFFI